MARGLFEAPTKGLAVQMSAPQNHTPTPHRGTPAITPPRGLRLREYHGRHRAEDCSALSQFRVDHLVKVNEAVAR